MDLSRYIFFTLFGLFRTIHCSALFIWGNSKDSLMTVLFFGERCIFLLVHFKKTKHLCICKWNYDSVVLKYDVSEESITMYCSKITQHYYIDAFATFMPHCCSLHSCHWGNRCFDWNWLRRTIDFDGLVNQPLSGSRYCETIICCLCRILSA